jgi:hypothetical protein
MKSSILILLTLLFALLPTPVLAQVRPAERAFKGIELYSWKNSAGHWVFALLPGTNRNKTEAEVKKRENEIISENELEKRFLQLAEGEEVFWFHRDPSGFAYPDEETMAKIATAARKAKVQLHVPSKKGNNR